jgi:hypothetical protein
MRRYPEAEQTYQAMMNLKAINHFVSFDLIFEEVQKVRLSRNLMANPENLKGRVRRSLTNDEETFKVNSSRQSNEFSVSKYFPEIMVRSKSPIEFSEKGLVRRTKDVEENSFSLIQKNK